MPKHRGIIFIIISSPQIITGDLSILQYKILTTQRTELPIAEYTHPLHPSANSKKILTKIKTELIDSLGIEPIGEPYVLKYTANRNKLCIVHAQPNILANKLYKWTPQIIPCQMFTNRRGILKKNPYTYQVHNNTNVQVKLNTIIHNIFFDSQDN